MPRFNYLVVTLLLAGLCVGIISPIASHSGELQANENPDKAGDLKVPADFALAYSSGPSHASWGGTVRVTLLADGTYKVEKQPRNAESGNPWQVKAQGRLEPAKLAEVFRAVEKFGFWNLEQQYSNPRIMDGFVNSLSVQADGRRHWVTIANTSVHQVQAIVAALRSAVPAKHRLF